MDIYPVIDIFPSIGLYDGNSSRGTLPEGESAPTDGRIIPPDVDGVFQPDRRPGIFDF